MTCLLAWVAADVLLQPVIDCGFEECQPFFCPHSFLVTCFGSLTLHRQVHQVPFIGCTLMRVTAALLSLRPSPYAA